MGLFLSVVISYAGLQEAIECIKHILSGMLPENDPDFQEFVEYYTSLQQKSSKQSNPHDVSVNWTKECGQGYLCLAEDDNGILKSAAVKYYDGQPNSTAILFSTKISSFGQESVEDSSQTNGDCRTERYTPSKTKTIITNTSDSFSIGYRNRSPTSENVSDPPFSANSFEHDDREEDNNDASDKLTWHYRPKSPIQLQQTLPEIQLQPFEDEDKRGVNVYSEEFLRSLDGIRFRPLQRSDPSGRRRSFKKRHSSSSTSSRESRASREEELKLFTSLEEAEFERMSNETAGFGSAPNLAPRSYSRSRSREDSKERRNETWSMDVSVDADDVTTELKPLVKDTKLDSFEEEREEAKETEVTEEEEVDDFWGSSGD